ncbi:hypothetical protein EXU57_00160 [Segetibacter sp. 3557_3]|uniref:PAS domain-containing protein n=1 Tax=Segetibacter sp. 3557_3 TaxID=2547429 RepID=UPI00105910D1|nr:PAS domain-containing protein [Segetibacter sp. 3557_3]TDH28530.1 hypothetical protein EXU57_00160 [Segetibacter sp. 3557_3]
MKLFEAAFSLFDKSQFFYLIATSMNGTYSYINSHYAKAFENVHPNFVGQPYNIMIPPEDSHICEDTAAKCFSDPDTFFPATLRKHDGNGGFITTQWEYKAMRNDEGVFTGIFCLGYDITQLVISQQELQIATTDIGKKKEVLRQIAYDQSHKVRLPLANILGLCDILQQLSMDANAANIVNMLRASAVQLDEMIRETVKSSYEERTR